MSGKTFGQRATHFYTSLPLPGRLPDGAEVLNPYAKKEVRDAVAAFCGTYFNDTERRVYVIGINPGRLGAGVTGIAFADTESLAVWGIENTVRETKELSAQFIRGVIEHCGGPEVFYRQFFLTSICPVGFIRNGVNMNYYDDAVFLKAVLPYMRETFKRQISFGAERTGVVLGKGKNFGVIEKLNRECGFFDRLLSLDHPRFIMQYRRKKVPEYLDGYRETLNEALRG